MSQSEQAQRKARPRSSDVVVTDSATTASAWSQTSSPSSCASSTLTVKNISFKASGPREYSMPKVSLSGSGKLGPSDRDIHGTSSMAYPGTMTTSLQLTLGIPLGLHTLDMIPSTVTAVDVDITQKPPDCTPFPYPKCLEECIIELYAEDTTSFFRRR